MTEILTYEEQNVLADYHLNLARDYLYEIIEELNRVNKKPDFNRIYKMEKAFSRELEISNHYKQKDEENDKTNN